MSKNITTKLEALLISHGIDDDNILSEVMEIANALGCINLSDPEKLREISRTLKIRFLQDDENGTDEKPGLSTNVDESPITPMIARKITAIIDTEADRRTRESGFSTVTLLIWLFLIGSITILFARQTMIIENQTSLTTMIGDINRSVTAQVQSNGAALSGRMDRIENQSKNSKKAFTKALLDSGLLDTGVIKEDEAQKAQ